MRTHWTNEEIHEIAEIQRALPTIGTPPARIDRPNQGYWWVLLATVQSLREPLRLRGELTPFVSWQHDWTAPLLRWEILRVNGSIEEFGSEEGFDWGNPFMIPVRLGPQIFPPALEDE